MTLLQAIELMEGVAAGQPAVNMIVRHDIYKMNALPCNRYGAFAWTEGTHRAGTDGFNTYAFTLFYVDRLTEDRGNLTEIHSVGVDVLGNILRTLADEVEVAGWTVTPFSGQRLGDECAGVYASVELTAPADSLCGHTYEEYVVKEKGAFDLSWSDAFQVWIWVTGNNKEIFVI